MRIKQTDAAGFDYLMAVDATEYHIILASVEHMRDLFVDTKDPTMDQRAMAIMLKAMAKQMEDGTRVRQHLPVQDTAISASERRDTVHIPPVERRPRSRVAVRAQDREVQDRH